jgi:H+/Cl- antiporter ClcA
MLSLRFFISWIFSAIIMYIAFYAWHGLYLDEISKIPYQKSIFFIFAGITYIIISFFLFKVYELKFLKKKVRNIFLRGILAGVVLGALVFVVTRVTDVGFTSRFSLTYLLFDGAWQILEQSVGGFVMALGTAFIYDPQLEQEAIKANL